MDKQILLYEYEQLLLGNKLAFSPYYFKCGDDTAKNNALYILKFAVEKYLRWSPYDVKNHFSKEIAEQLKLDGILKYIDFPPELNKSTDYSYYATLLYPSIIRFDTKEIILRVYRDVLSGALCKFPKEFLSGTQGMYKAGICLQYALNHHLAHTFQSIRELYEYFAGPEGGKFLKKVRLFAICNEIYDYPLDYIHDALPPDQRDDFWYHYYRFRIYNQSYLQKLRRFICLKELEEKEENI